MLEIDELAEASIARYNGVLSDSSVRYLGEGLAKRIKNDDGLGSQSRRGQIIDHVKRSLQSDSHDLHALNLIREEVAPLYLRNWADAVRTKDVPFESLARAVASHLLDCGYSPTALHKWFTYFCSHAPDSMSVADIVEQAAQLPARPFVRYQALVPIIAAPPLDFAPAEWLSAAATSHWLKAWYPNMPAVRQSGGLLLELDSRDIYSAISRVRAILERLSARFRVGARKVLRFHDSVYLLGETNPLPLSAGPRRVEVQALERTRTIFDLQLPPQVDAALELLEPLDSGAPAAAVAGSWAAMETLLIGPGDTSNRVVAATRMARIVACSYLRSEFTSLANAHITESSDEIAGRLRSLSENKDRATLLEQLFRDRAEPDYVGERHKIAALRMRQAVDNPLRTLDRIVQQLEDAFRRLYRQRNLIVHAGQTSSVALDGCLRTCSPLIGAGTDRVVHASAIAGVAPLQLSALAEVRLHEARMGSALFVGMLP